MVIATLASVLWLVAMVQPPAEAPKASAPPAAAAAEPAHKRLELTVDGTPRLAMLFVPEAATKEATPVIFAFHGHGGSATSASRTFDYQKEWPEAITVYMQGLPAPGKTDPEGKKNGWQKTVGDLGDRDLKFFDAVLASLKKDYKVDESRVYATGFSNGGGFTYVLWEGRPDVFAAVAPAAGVMREAKTLKPMPAMCIAGDKDHIAPYALQQKMMDAVKKVNGCAEKGEEWAKPASGACTLYSSSGGTPLVTYIFPGGHQFPDDAPALIVKFFKEHPKAKDGTGEKPAAR